MVFLRSKEDRDVGDWLTYRLHLFLDKKSVSSCFLNLYIVILGYNIEREE